MAVTGGKKKKPPMFHYLPKRRAHQLKQSWVEDHKIRSKWKAQKRKDGLTNQTSIPVDNTSTHAHSETVVDFESDASSNCPEKSPIPTPSHDKQSLRDLRRIAYASKPLPTQKANSSRSERVPGRSHIDRSAKAKAGRRETSQPNMKLRMNVLLEKIKRDIS